MGVQMFCRSLLGYDNSEFLNSLRQRGFYVADCSQSNYAYTEFSLTSSLNYDYLDNLDVSTAAPIVSPCLSIVPSVHFSRRMVTRLLLFRPAGHLQSGRMRICIWIMSILSLR